MLGVGWGGVISLLGKKEKNKNKSKEKKLKGNTIISILGARGGGGKGFNNTLSNTREKKEGGTVAS